MLGDHTLREVYGFIAERHDAPAVGGAPPAASSEGEAARTEFQRLSETFARLAERWRVGARLSLAGLRRQLAA